MKKTIFTIIAIGFLGVLACSNKKDPEPAPKSKTELLTAHPWKYASEQDSTGKNMPINKCLQDDYYTFLTDNYVEINEGDSICKDTEVLTRENKWYFQENDTKLWFYRINMVTSVLKLDDDSLIVKSDMDKGVIKFVK